MNEAARTGEVGETVTTPNSAPTDEPSAHAPVSAGDHPPKAVGERHLLTPTVANELVKLSEQHAQGVISDTEFLRARDQLLG